MGGQHRRQEEGDRSRPMARTPVGPVARPTPASMVSRAGVLGLQRTAGNRAVAAMFAMAQPKLTVGPAGDRFEQEADRVADVVMRNLPSRTGAEAEAEAEPDERTVRRAGVPQIPGAETPGEPIGLGGGDVARDTEAQLRQARSGGAQLPAGLRSSMEHAMRADFGGVRVHAGPQSDTLSQSMQARAFTVGHDIFFARSQFRPGTAAGQRLIAHELTHTLQQGGTSLHREVTSRPGGVVVQREVLDAAGILASLEKISFIKKKLGQSLDLRRTGQVAGADTMRQHVQDVLQQYQSHLKGDDETVNQAMMIAAVLERVAKVIAVNELNDPTLTPILSVKLLEFYRPEIESKLKKMDSKDDALKLAHALIADDPLALYLHGELRREAASRRIRNMAFAAGRQPGDMFDLLRQRFEIEMATHTKTSVTKQQDTAVAYNVKETTGEISSNYFGRLFGTGVETPTWSGGPKKGITFTADTTDRLDDLKAAVTAEAPKVRTKETPADLTVKQAEHLEDIEEGEKRISYSDVNAQVEKALVTVLGVTQDEAAVLRAKVQAGLKDIPIILGVGGMDWFGTKVPDPAKGETAYKAFSGRRNEAEYSKLFGKKKAKGSIKHLGEFPRPEFQSRGKNYLRFRNWKDQVMSGARGFSDEELPTFAAMSMNWAAKGTQSHMAGNYGVNPYGDTQFRLKKGLLKNAIFTATDHGQPRRDPYLAFADMLLGGEGVTRLKDVKSVKHALHLLNSVTTKKAVAAGTQYMEIQIFGHIDIARDVEKIYVAPTADKAVKDNVLAFSRNTGVRCKFLEAKDDVVSETYFMSTVGGTQQSDFSKQVKQQLADERAAATPPAAAPDDLESAPPKRLNTRRRKRRRGATPVVESID